MRLKFELNQAEFIIRVVDNNWKPGYICVLGFDNEIITKQLQAEVLIFPLQIIIHGIKVFMATLGSSDQAELNLQVLVIVHLFIIKSPLEFWTCADSTTDGALILYLYTKNLLNGIPYDPSKSEMVVKNQELQSKVDQFWNCFDTSIKINKRGLEDKQRILSVIANDFGRQEIKEKLNISNDLMNAARKYSRTNGPGCITIIFDTLTSLIQLNITDQGERNKLITELEKLRVHLRRGFEEELTMNGDGTTIHQERPRWAEIVSDNGAHYHNSELIATIANWYQWYNIEIRGWYFLEPSEAKTTIDSHHAQIDHAIKRYIRIGHNLDEGEKIQTAIADLGGTSVANLEPIRDNHKVKTIAGITKLFYFEWPIDGDYAGYIRAQCLPHIGSWSQFSPFEISKLTTTPINKPISNTTPHSAPKNPWIFSLSRVQNVNNQEKDNNQVRLLLAIEETFELKRGWALKTGNMNWTDRMTAKDMVEQLQILADEGEIDVEDVPEITTVASWITRYAASLKKQSAIEKAAEGSNTEMLIIFKKW
ncbi:unnamed protein product [Rhizophagus irregularis]|nr:unnamed protein product [Rhizophagus irregularis]